MAILADPGAYLAAAPRAAEAEAGICRRRIRRLAAEGEAARPSVSFITPGKQQEAAGGILRPPLADMKAKIACKSGKQGCCLPGHSVYLVAFGGKADISYRLPNNRDL
jgi:hypothetical protein